MTDDPEQQHRQALALFRYGLIADLIQRPPGTQGLYARIQEKAAIPYTIPGSTRTRVAPETLRDWLKRYRHGGFEALLPKPRSDRGRPRLLPEAVADLLVSIKEDHPKLSVPLVIREARASGHVPADLPLPPSTVHRLLTQAGLMCKDLNAPTAADRRRFAFAKAGELWMSDVMHGPTVFVGDRTRRKTYLIAFLDDATRVIPYAAFALSENTQAFLPVFKQALMRRGLPLRLYVDNGANYRSQHLALVCAKLGIALIHARAYQPQGKGKLERWFRTLRAQLLTRLTPEDTRRLEALNRRLWAWVEGEYHHTPHRSLEGQTPLERWASHADEVHFPDPTLDLDEVFLFEAKRKVQKDRTVSLNGVVYEVDAALVGQNVILRYDPAAPPGRSIEVWHPQQPGALARPLDTYANCFVKRHRPSGTATADTPAPQPPPSGLNLRELPNSEENR
ncbi:MAG: helix-turn-helix domain-containing protein [Nitrospiraceae bacterium]